MIKEYLFSVDGEKVQQAAITAGAAKNKIIKAFPKAERIKLLKIMSYPHSEKGKKI